MDGWSVVSRLKRNPRTRHIPVHVISVSDRHPRGVSMGAFSFLEKPVSRDALDGALTHISHFLEREVWRVLLVEDNQNERNTVGELIGEGDDVEVVAAPTAEEALEILSNQEVGCLVVDLLLPGEDGFQLIERVRGQERFVDLPIVVYTAKDLTMREETRLKKYAESIIVKSSASAPDRLLRETSLFLHRAHERLPDRARAAFETGEAQRVLQNKKVLIVDDDARNIIALTSILEGQGMEVIYAENGRAGIELLSRNPDTDIVLMDIMMPELDGYETMKLIRRDTRFRQLPIIALTAKALKDDRERCIQAGASDYLPKPVDADKLTEVLRLWVRD